MEALSLRLGTALFLIVLGNAQLKALETGTQLDLTTAIGQQLKCTAPTVAIEESMESQMTLSGLDQA